MIKTYSQSQFSELRYVVPVDLLALESPRQVTGLHVLEHWLLEGAGDLPDAEAVFAAARRLGGSIEAAVSRKVVQVRLSYLGSRHHEAEQLLRKVIKEPKLDPGDLPGQIADVRDELKHDGELTKLFDLYYAAAFSDRYAWAGGGTLDDLSKLSDADCLELAARWRGARGQIFWAGPKEYEPATVNLAEIGDDFRFIKPKFQPVNQLFEGKGLNLLPVEVPGGVAVEWFMHARFGNFASLQQHILPGVVLQGVSFDAPEISQKDVERAVGDFTALTSAERRAWDELGSAERADDYLQPQSANRRVVDDWVFQTV